MNDSADETNRDGSGDQSESVAPQSSGTEPVGSEPETGAPGADSVAVASAESTDGAETAEDAVPTIEPDQVLLAAQDFARAALTEITPAATVGAYFGYIVHDEHVLSLQFESNLAGYPDWYWTVGLSRIDEDSAPNVLETELIPSANSMVAPDWIPWSERLADYRLAQEHAALLAAAELDEDDDDDLDEGDLDDGDELDLDDHILDDQMLDSDDDDSDDDDDDSDDDSDSDSDSDDDDFVPSGRSNRSRNRSRSGRSRVDAPERDAEGNLDASVVIAKADRTPRRRRSTGAPVDLDHVDLEQKGLSVVEIDADTQRAGVYYDEEAADLEH